MTDRAGTTGTIRHGTWDERERALAELASRQDGVVARHQLTALGFSRAAIETRLVQRRLQPVHAGVYAVGVGARGPAALRRAAVLACGDGAVASHLTAAAAWQLGEERGRSRHVTVLPCNGSRSRAGLVVHRTQLRADDIGRTKGLPVTTVARTLIDLGDLLPAVRVRRAFVRAEQLRLLDMEEVGAALERATRRRGPHVLRGVLRAYDPRWARTRSSLELRMLDIVRLAAIREPEVNAWIEGTWEADLLWRAERVVVEVDGAAVHATPSARGRDALRDRALRARGYRVLRVPEADLDRPDLVKRRLRRALRPQR